MTMTPGYLINADDIDPYPYRRSIDRDGASTMVLVTAETPYRWALVQRHVSGWTCLAVGSLADSPAIDQSDVVDVVTDHYGDGFDRIPREQYGMTGPNASVIHLRRTPGESYTYCPVTAPAPYVHVKGRHMQHCIACTGAYRAEHYGRCPSEV